MDQDKHIAEVESQIRVLHGKMVLGRVEVMLLDFEMEVRNAFPNTVPVEPTANKIVAYLREHIA